MDLDNYVNIDVVKRPSIEDEVDPMLDSNDRRFKYLYFVSKQHYFREKVYDSMTWEQVEDELRKNDVVGITRITPYDNLVIVQYELVRW